MMRAHRCTVEQLAILEPALSETVGATFALALREATDEAVRRGVPKQAAGFDEPKLVLLLLYAVFAAGRGPHGNDSVLDFLGINADKVRETIIAERKQAQANARMKAKLAKASPLVKSKKPGKKSAKRK